VKNYNTLINRLDKFIKKYYTNQLIKGVIYFIGLFVAFYLSVVIVEYYAHFDILPRTILFYIYLSLNFIITIRLIVLPLLKLYKIGKRISNEDAAEIIGKHFSEVKDKLLNTLQLKNFENISKSDSDLIEASIDQKIEQLKPIPFNTAIEFKSNRKYIKYSIPPVVILVVLLFTAPSVLTEPTTRLVNHKEFYEIESPFSIKIQNEELIAIQQEDYVLNVKVIGNEVPDIVFLETGGIKYKLNKDNNICFNHVFKNVQKEIEFRLVAGRYNTEAFELKVIPKPIILNFETEFIYPEYLNKKKEIISNTGDIVIPEGTRVGWRFYTRDTKLINLFFDNYKVDVETKSSNTFQYYNTFKKSQNYTIKTSNQFINSTDSLTYAITVIPDAYPTIRVKEFKDSLYESRLFFQGIIKDDYGFSSLNFNYKFFNDTDSIKDNSIRYNMPLSKIKTEHQFFHYFDMSELNVKPGDRIEYYFEVWDNDGINGYKPTRSHKMIFKVPTIEEIENRTKASNDEIKDDLEKTIDEAKKLQDDIDKLNKELINKKKISWQEKKKIEDLLQRQKEMRNRVDRIKEKNINKAEQEKQYKQVNENIIEKQKQLEELFEKVMDEETKMLLEELDKLMEKVDKKNVNEMLDKMKLSAEDLEKQLDRNLEFFKQAELEKKMEETIEKLDEIKEEQQELGEKTDDRINDKEELKKKQENLNDKFDEIKEDIKEIEEMNRNLETPNKLENTDKEQKRIESEMENSSNLLNKGQRKKASQSQKNASEEMENLSEKMKDMQSNMQSNEIAEDIDALRAILENLVRTSFDQEELMNKLKGINKNDPKYVDLIKEQQRIKDGLRMIEDSLIALSKRQISIEPFVNKEISKININVERAINFLLDYQGKAGYSNTKSQAISKQQYVMTSINNLALLLDEALNSMQNQMSNQMKGSKKNCAKPKPGQSGEGMKSIRQLQQELNRQIEQLKNGKKQGKKDGKNPGSKSQSEQLARLAAQQAAIRKMMQEYGEQNGEEGKEGNSNLNKIAQEMEKTETDLVNKMISNETLMRQEEILTRLLESEKAERKRELDKKRESNEAKKRDYSNPNDFLEYKRIKAKEKELLKTVPPELKLFYKKKVNEYFYKFE